MTPEEWGYSVVGSLGPSEREVHAEIVRRVAELVRIAIREEREACAKVADDEALDMTGVMSSSAGYNGVARRIASAIRSRRE